MSKLDGHYKISRQAVREIQKNCNNHSLGSNLTVADLASYVVTRDLIDAITLGHWADFAQSHHFMRRFDGQSQRAAYDESVEWVRSNALEAAGVLYNRISVYKRNINNVGLAAHARGTARISCKLAPMPAATAHSIVGRDILGGNHSSHNEVSWQNLGSALHAMQDSFSLGHVIRSNTDNENQPGVIEKVKLYMGSDKIGHSKYDTQWQKLTPKGTPFISFSLSGRLAVNASRELIVLVINTAITHTSVSAPAVLKGWELYKDKWLVASPTLDDTRTFSIDFIERFHVGMHLGANNLVTFSMDEEAMAHALVNELSTNTQAIYEVFVRLDKHYNSDADDIAELYVNKIKNKKGVIVRAIAGNKQLVKILIKVMQEGVLTDGEQESIDFLNKL